MGKIHSFKKKIAVLALDGTLRHVTFHDNDNISTKKNLQTTAWKVQ